MFFSNSSCILNSLLLLDNNQYNESFKFLKKLDGLESSHINYSVKYLYSLINSGNFIEAFNYSRKLEKQKLDNLESNLIIGIFYLKNSNYDLAEKYFLKAKNKNSNFLLNNYISDSLHNWSNLKNIDLESAEIKIEKLDNRFKNLKKYKMFF